MLRTQDAQCHLRALSRLIGAGVLILGPSNELEFADTLACELLGCCDSAQLGERWSGLRRALQLDDDIPAGGLAVDVATEGENRMLRLEGRSLAEEGCEDRLILLRDRRTLGVLETDLLLASRMRSLVHEHRMVAHDLRAPLNAMHLSLELLAVMLSEQPPVARGSAEAAPRWQRHVAIMREELTRLHRSLEATLEQREPISAESETFDLRGIASEVVRLLGPQARKQQVEIVTNLPETPALVRGVPGRLRQALLNIVINALGTMDQGGRLTVLVQSQGEQVLVRVEDTGRQRAAIAGEIQAMDLAARDADLGLYVARRVIESNDGRLVQEDSRDHGRRVTLSFPAARNN